LLRRGTRQEKQGYKQNGWKQFFSVHHPLLMKKCKFFGMGSLSIGLKQPPMLFQQTPPLLSQKEGSFFPALVFVDHSDNTILSVAAMEN
jgi:hypothetical protein